MNELPRSIAELPEPSEYLKEVLATPPRWVIRWGETLVLILTMLLLALGWLIRYPDRIPAEVMITTRQPPVPVKARANGALTQLLVSDHDTVATGQLLAIVQNPARYGDVSRLKRQLRQFDIDKVTLQSPFTTAYQLGSLQEAYTYLQQTAEAFHLYRSLTPLYQQQQAVVQQLVRYQALLTQNKQQQQLLQRKAQLAEKDYRRNEQLHASGAIADRALEESERQWLEAREAYEVLRSELSRTNVQIADLERERTQLGTQHTQEGEQLRITLLSALHQLQSSIKQWEEHHLLIAPQAGQVSFSDFWSEQQFVEVGQTVMRIIPSTDEQAGGVIGQLRVPVQNSGKLAAGQRVEVYLDNYPHAEYGTLTGTVERISSLPKQGQYHLTITFPNGLVTQYDRRIPFQQQLQGTAEIITEELRLLERLFYQLRSVLDESSPREEGSTSDSPRVFEDTVTVVG